MCSKTFLAHLHLFSRIACISLFIGGHASLSTAQNFSQAARPYVQSIEALGMGDAVAAIPSPHTALFYNPAHFAYLPPFRPIINAIGVRTAFNSNVVEQINYYRKDLKPATEDGLENLSAAELSKLYERALDLGRQRTFLNAAVLGPSIMLNAGRIGVGGGLYGNSYIRYHFSDAGAGVPRIDMAGVADGIITAGGGMHLGFIGLRDVAFGVNGKYIQRYATIKKKPLDVIGAEEPLHIFSAKAVSFDFGVLAEIPLFQFIPGRFQFGAAVYDIAPRKFSFQYDRTWSSSLSYDAAIVDPERQVVQESLNLSMSYRIGVAYVLPSLLGLFKETGVAVDYVGILNPIVDQSFMTNLRIGLQLNVPFLAVRLGYNQGYPTAGVGVSLGFIRLNYAYYGIEEGRLPGQSPSWNHAVQVSLGVF